jgi:hypothetical protein
VVGSAEMTKENGKAKWYLERFYVALKSGWPSDKMVWYERPDCGEVLRGAAGLAGNDQSFRRYKCGGFG